eukprot:scaffold131057_cov66-Phaeocystis_antarctica.AAC.4
MASMQQQPSQMHQERLGAIVNCRAHPALCAGVLWITSGRSLSHSTLQMGLGANGLAAAAERAAAEAASGGQQRRA